ncbi:EamA family transporter [Rubripirellula sp.]|nr:EamA family transporter [Rubripirellula sp.]
MIGYLYIAGCIAFTVYGQLVIKWRMGTKGELPQATFDKFIFLLQTLFGDLYILSGFAAAFAASLFWMAAMTKFELSFAYPFMSLAFVLVLLLGVMLLGETLTAGKACGVLIICAGIAVSTRFS